jgi:CubicO group peptidase (beta-lactamase class C family)
MILPSNPSMENPITYQDGSSYSASQKELIAKKRISVAFDHQLRKDIKLGAQLVILKDGNVIADLWGGVADIKKRTPVTHTTKFQAFSIIKSLIAACVFKLIDEGSISLEGKISDYWPEFGTHGKREITIRQVLLHQAGLPRRGLFAQILFLNDWERIIQNLARKRPEYPPGNITAYHSLNYGYILGEVISRVSGTPVKDILANKFTKPLGMDDTNMTLVPSEESNIARLTSGVIDQHAVAWFYNSKRLKQSVVPAGSLHTTSRDLAIFYQMVLNEGRYAGGNYLNSESIRLSTSLGFEGFDKSYGRLTRWGYGFNLGGEHGLNPAMPDGMGARSSLTTFGHYGQRTSLTWGDKRERIVFVFLCNRLLSHIGYKDRVREISDVVWDALQD